MGNLVCLNSLGGENREGDGTILVAKQPRHKINPKLGPRKHKLIKEAMVIQGTFEMLGCGEPHLLRIFTYTNKNVQNL